jgi:hypothetical protein
MAPKPEGSSPCSQEPNTGSYSEPTEFTLPPAILPIIHSEPILPSATRSSSGLFPSEFPIEYLYVFLPCVPHVTPTTLFDLVCLTIFVDEYKL